MVLKDNIPVLQRVNHTVLAVFLLLSIGGIVGVLFVLSKVAAQADQETRRVLVRVMWVAAAGIATDALLLLWLLLRWMRGKTLSSAAPPTETPYVDAWAEAGRRLKVDDEENPYQSF